MQDKNQSFEDFSKRTEMLALRLSKNVSELPEFLNISASMLHSYRSGKHPISLKAWRKLAEAEKKIGVISETKKTPASIYPTDEPLSGLKILQENNPTQMDRIEHKLDVLLRHLGVEGGKGPYE